MDTKKRPPSVDGKLKKEFLQFKDEKNRTLNGTLKDLGETSTLHGISKIASSRQVVVKILWCILFLGTFAVFIIQLYQLFKTFYSYPVQTTVSLEFDSIAFPAITLCNMNPVKNDKLHMVPALKEVIDKGQNPNKLLRSRREAKRKLKTNGQVSHSPTSSSSEAYEKNAKILSRDENPFNLKETLKNEENKNKQSRFNENSEPPEMIYLAKKGLRRRKRDVSITPSGSSDTIDYKTVSSDTLFTSHQLTQTVSTTSMFQSISVDSTQTSGQDIIQPSSDFSETVDLLSSGDIVSNYPKTTHSVINTGSISPEITFTEDPFLSPSTRNLSVTDFSLLNTTDSFSLNTDYLGSQNTIQSATSIPWPSTFSDNLQSPSLNLGTSYPDYTNTWEAWYDYYNYDYHPSMYDPNYWYDWYYYSDWNYYDYGGSFFFDQLHSKKDEWDERVENFRTVFKNETVEKRKEIGHQKEDMIVAASFAGRVQNITHFQNFTSVEYGNCYTMASPKYVAWRSGPTYGVKLTLNLEIDEYVPNFSTGYGIRIVFHEPGTHPLPSHEGITLSPGTETNIGLRMIRISRLGEPHGDCVDGNEFAKRYHKRYSISSCYEFCRIHKTIQTCNCIPVEAPDGINLNSTILPVCNSSVKEVKSCLLDVDVKFDNGEYSCDCRGPCNETAYAKTLSSTYWPTDDYLEVLISELCEKYNTSYWINLCSSFENMPYWELDRFRYNFLRVLVYFEDLNYETITEEPLYESVRFLSDIGGAMGLFLGASVLSFVEVVQLLLELFLYMKYKHIDNKKTRVSNFSEK